MAILEVAVSETPRTDAIVKRFEGRDTKSLTYHDVNAIAALSRSLEEELNMAMRLNKAMRDELDSRIANNPPCVTGAASDMPCQEGRP